MNRLLLSILPHVPLYTATGMPAIGSVQIKIKVDQDVVCCVLLDMSKKQQIEDVDAKEIPVSGRVQIVNVSLQVS